MRTDQPVSRRELSQQELARYSRHIMLPDVGIQGQETLTSARVAVVGAGGLGSPLLMYLAAAGVGHLTVIDGDVVDRTNLQRQVVHSEATLGLEKVASAAAALARLNSGVVVEPVAAALTAENALELLAGHDLVVDGTDNYSSRYLISDACARLGVPDVWASVFQFEGQISTWWAGRGPCYRCVFPHPPAAGLVPSCAEGGVFGALCGVIGASQANEVLRILLGIGEPLVGRMALYDGLQGRWDEVKIDRDPRCAACGPNADQTTLAALGACAVDAAPALLPEQEVSATDLAAMLAAPSLRLRVIDVRGVDEQTIVAIPGAEAIHLSEFENGTAHRHLSPDDDVVLYCKSGARSTRALSMLPPGTVKQARHLRGGVLAWVDDVDPRLPRY